MTRTTTSLWQTAFRDQQDNPCSIRIRAALETFERRAADLTGLIAADFPNLTVHDLTHLNALWETADLVCGDGYPLNPLEAFVLAGAILLHDAALCFEAYEGGRSHVRQHSAWLDALALERRRYPDKLESELETSADFVAVRQLHALQAAELAKRSWKHPTTNEELYLIEDSDLRLRFGHLVGQIAASHHWPIEDLTSKLPDQVNAPGTYPLEWRVDPVKIACVLRVADAMHLDNRRAPDFLFALLKRQGLSFDHWKAQNWLSRIDADQSTIDPPSLLITSNQDFGVQDVDAWWVAYDAAQLANKKLQSANELLLARNRPNSPAFHYKQISDVDSPVLFAKHVRTRNWQPHSVHLHVGNVKHLVGTLGGTKLYGEGNELVTVLRELVQNARDSITARRKQQTSDYTGRLRVTATRMDDTYTTVSFDDDGVGMSPRVLTGPLLDFGSSFWASDLVKAEFPGLASSNFRSAGKFGIGFYSCFMVADSVTIASRRWDRGLDTATELSFPSGLSLRPVLRQNVSGSIQGYTSTLVTLKINHNKFSLNNIVVERNNDQSTRIAIDLAGALSSVCSALDIDVFYTNEERKDVQIHWSTEIEWTAEDRSNWLKRIAYRSYAPNDTPESFYDEAASRLRDIVRDGRLVMRAALNLSHRQVHRCSAVTVDGLGGAQSGSSYYLGFVDHSTETAKRDANKIVASTEELQAWFAEQIQLISPRPKEDIFMLTLPYVMSNAGISPKAYATITIGNASGGFRVLSVSECFAFLKVQNIAFFESNHLRIIETYIQQRNFENYWTILPLDNGTYLWTDVGDEKHRQVSFLGLLADFAFSQKTQLVISEKRVTNAWSLGGNVAARVISLSAG